jgi:transposase
MIETANAALKSDNTKVLISSLVDMISIMANRLGLNSSNSSKPPSTDPNRVRSKKVTKGKKRKPGGQKGHSGSRLEPVPNPTTIEDLEIDRRTLPPGKWTTDG